MAKVVGQCTCPECGFTDAEVRRDRNAHLYRYCPDCTAQYFTYGDAVKSANLLRQVVAPAGPRSSSRSPALATVGA